jgi:hypothetical protein
MPNGIHPLENGSGGLLESGHGEAVPLRVDSTFKVYLRTFLIIHDECQSGTPKSRKIWYTLAILLCRENTQW